MLEEIQVSNCATYSAQGATLNDCRKVNYIFGTNGVGKTTLSRFIHDPNNTKYKDCSLRWKNKQPLEVLVFNSDFASKSFELANSSLPAIFTLGEESVEKMEEMSRLRRERVAKEDEVARLRGTLQTHEDNYIAEQQKIQSVCWDTMKRYTSRFGDAFSGLRNSKAKASARFLHEARTNASVLRDEDFLTERAKKLFNEVSEELVVIDVPNFSGIISAETNPILRLRIVGREDVNIAELIARLGNSDWVKQGRAFLSESKPDCPFCQQKIDADLEDQLNSYFDDAYSNNVAAVQNLRNAYAENASSVTRELSSIRSSASTLAQDSAFILRVSKLTLLMQENLRAVERKLAEPSAVVILTDIKSECEEIGSLIKNANAIAASHNELIRNRFSEREVLVGEIWRFVVDQIRLPLADFIKNEENYHKGRTGIEGRISKKVEDIKGINDAISEIEKSVTSVKPTVNAINQILASFGYVGFKLEASGKNEELYKVVRPDGIDALRTLSEGEKTFITFLYFYHRARGSITATGVNDDRVVFIDDPISSLDSDVMFIVSTLVRSLVEDACGDESSPIKQVFVSTHNVYFHKEVTFDPNRGNGCARTEAFFVVRKSGNISHIERKKTNPIKTSYDLLWQELRGPNVNPVTVRNSMRRIIESYFKLTGGIDPDDILALFDGKDKFVCRALFSWMNDGSHAVREDVFLADDGADLPIYMRVFQQIFEKSNHGAHYRMMMGEAVDFAAAGSA